MHVRKRWLSLVVAVGAFAPACMAEDDADFARQAASTGLLEVELGNYAASNAADPEVARFGRAMVDDHSRVNQELEALARRKGIRLHSSMTPEQRQEATQLMSKQGADFDAAYVQAMVQGHEKAVAAFQKQADQDKTEVDRWAASTLPALQQHLAHARELAAKDGNARVSQVQ
jgi:putative membrane protein